MSVSAGDEVSSISGSDSDTSSLAVSDSDTELVSTQSCQRRLHTERLMLRNSAGQLLSIHQCVVNQHKVHTGTHARTHARTLTHTRTHMRYINGHFSGEPELAFIIIEQCRSLLWVFLSIAFCYMIISNDDDDDDDIAVYYNCSVSVSVY